MALQFATIEQFYEFQGKAVPADISAEEILRLNALLTRASDRIRARVRLARVRYLNTGFPQNGTIADGYARATAATAVWWEGAGDDGSGSSSRYDSVSMDGVSYSRSTSAAAAAQTSPAQDRIAPEAEDILLALGIFSTGVWH